jgi:uncharacterized membrane protein
MTKPIKALDTKLYYARRVTWYSYFLFLLSLWTGGLLSANPTPFSLLAIVSLPLILFLPGMARENHKSLIMLSFVTLMYFIHLVVNVGKPDYELFDVISLVLICILFTSSMLFSRWIQYHRAGLGAP